MSRMLLVWVVLLALVLTGQCAAAIQAGMHWNVQTTGVATNAGGFDPTVASPGTDESQGSGTAITVTAATTTGTGSPAFTSTTHGPGNTVIIASGAGCNTGTFEILSQAAGTATFDRSMGTGSCVGVIGGTKTLRATLASGPTVTGNTVDIKAGTYTNTTNITVDAVSILLWGYGVTPGDNGTRPLITTATNSVVLLSVPGGPTTVRNVNFSNTAGTRGDCINASVSAKLWVQSATFDGCQVAINGDNGVGSALVATTYNTEIKNSISDGMRLAAGGLNTIGPGSWIHNNAGWGVELLLSGSFGISVVGAVISVNGSGGSGGGITGVNVSGCPMLIAFSDISHNTGPGIAPSGCALSIVNSIIYGNSTFGIANFAGTGVSGQEINNGFGANSTANRQYTAGPSVIGDLAFSADPATSTSNFALNATAGGGPVAKQAGFPGIGPAGTGFADIGAIQTSGAPGTGGVSVAAYSQ